MSKTFKLGKNDAPDGLIEALRGLAGTPCVVQLTVMPMDENAEPKPALPETSAMKVGDVYEIEHAEYGTLKYRVASYIARFSIINGVKPVAFMAPITIPSCSVQFNADGNNEYEDSTYDKWLNNEFKNGLPQSVRDRIVPRRIALTDGNGGVKHILRDVWAPSEEEMYGSAIYGNDVETTNACRLWGDRKSRCFKDTDGDERSGLLRAAYASLSDYACIVYTDGTANYYGVDGSGGALSCFCLG